MNNSLRKRLVVARWEFMRYFKWRSELVALLLAGALIGLVYGGMWLMDRYKADERFEVAAIGLEHIDLPAAEYQQIQLQAASMQDLPALETRLADEALDGILMIDSPTQARLRADRGAGWHGQLEALLNEAARDQALTRADVSAEQFQHWLNPIGLSVELNATGDAASTRSESNARRFAMVVLGFMLFAVFNSFAYYFASITTEKQQRVCEQILSAIPSQVWIDGKILGLTVLGCKSLINILVWACAGFAVYVITTGEMPEVLSLLPTANVAAVVLMFSLLGLFFWNSILAAVAATIDDPNSSSRSSLMLLPIVPVVLVFFALDISTSPIMLFMSWFPPTAWAAMPARHVIDGVATWELLGSLLLMVGAVYWARGAAGRIFTTGILMYGKEPGWKHMARAALGRN